jgi:YHS domain-containing protein
MKKSIIMILLLSAAGLAFAEGKAQTTCPVMGGKINKAQYAEVNGKRIYVCCAGCISKIKAEPAKYIKQLESKGIVLEKAVEKKGTSTPKSGCGGCGSH